MQHSWDPHEEEMICLRAFLEGPGELPWPTLREETEFEVSSVPMTRKDARMPKPKFSGVS